MHYTPPSTYIKTHIHTPTHGKKKIEYEQFFTSANLSLFFNILSCPFVVGWKQLQIWKRIKKKKTSEFYYGTYS